MTLKLPGIPDITPNNHQQVLEIMKQILEVRQGWRGPVSAGDRPNRFVTLDEVAALIATAVAGISVSGSGITGTFKAWEVVQEWTLSNEVLDETISGLAGDTDSEYEIRFTLIGSGSTPQVLGQLNGDSGNNYSTRYIYVDPSGSHVSGEVNPASSMGLGVGQDGHYGSGVTQLFLKSGGERLSITSSMRGGQYLQISGGIWTNTTDEVTSIRIFTDNAATGKVGLYKLATIA